jgi:hypothetical protein
MAVTGYTLQAYAQFLQQGGTLTFQVEAEDIDEVNGDKFEHFPSISPDLQSGFELPPSSVVIDDDKAYVQALLHGVMWTRLIVYVYSRGGKIVYHKTGPGSYQAVATI